MLFLQPGPHLSDQTNVFFVCFFDQLFGFNLFTAADVLLAPSAGVVIVSQGPFPFGRKGFPSNLSGDVLVSKFTKTEKLLLNDFHKL